MQKKFTSVIAVILAMVMLFAFSSCSSTADEDEAEPTAAVIPVSAGIPVSETEIIDFFNNTVSYIEKDGNFTSESKPGVKTDESLSAGNIDILKYNKASNEATPDDSLEPLKKSASAIKDRIIGGIDTSIPVVKFGDMSSKISSVIYPYDSDMQVIRPDDVIKAECNVDGSNLNIKITLTNTAAAIENVFGIRDKATVISAINEKAAAYAELSDYTVKYVETNTEDDNEHSTIELSVEVEKQSDGSYECTGRITSLKYRIVADVKAIVLCKGSFEQYGDLQVNLRFYDEKSYSFDWYGSATWEPTTAESK